MAKGAVRGFVDLDVYHLSEELADAIWNLVLRWDGLAKDTVGKQLIRAADSIGANIAEGSGRGTYRDNHHFINISRGSFYETRHGLRRAFRRKLLTPDQVRKLRPLIKELGPCLNGYRNSLRRKMNIKTLRARRNAND
jgi:four helix bundle protein